MGLKLLPRGAIARIHHPNDCYRSFAETMVSFVEDMLPALATNWLHTAWTLNASYRDGLRRQRPNLLYPTAQHLFVLPEGQCQWF